MSRLTSEGSLSIFEFFDLFEQTLDKAWNGSSKKNVEVYEAYPDHIKDPFMAPLIVTWGYTRRPWEKEIKPRIRNNILLEDDPSNTVQVWGQKFTCIVEFELWSYDQKLLNTRSEQFSEFMTAFIPFFKRSGAGEIIFLEESNIDPQRSWRESLYGRSHVYRVDIEKLIPVSTSAINQITAEIRVKHDYRDDDSLANKIILTQ